MLITVITIISLVLLVYLLLWMPPIQQKVKDLALKEVMKKTRNQMSIGKLKFRPFNQLQLEDVYAADLNGDTLLYAHKLSAGFNLFGLLNNQLLIESIVLDDFVIRVNRDSVGTPFNFQFFIDAFASPDTIQEKDSAGMVIQIDRVQLKRGKLTYDILSQPALSDSIFDANHINIRDLDADINLKSIDLRKLDVAVKSFSFKEQSGFELKNLLLNITSKKEKIFLEKLNIQLPSSELALGESWVDYSGFELSQLMQGATYSLSFGNNRLWPSDLKMFYPPLAQLSDYLHLEGEVSGTFPEINLSRIQANYGKHMVLDADAQIDNFNDWKTSPFRLNLNQFFIDTHGMREVLAFTSTGKKPIIPTQVQSVTLRGEVSGSLPDLSMNLNANSQTGTLDLKGTGGYLFDSGRSRFDVKLVATNFDLRTFMQGNPLYGKVSLSLNTKGEISGSGAINAQGKVSVDRFDFKQYTYRDIQAQVFYRGDSARLNLVSNDVSLPLEIQGAADLGKRNPNAQVTARLNHLRLDTLNLLPSMPGADLYALIQADIKGFDPESMIANLRLDSLSFRTQKGLFEEDSVQLDYQALPNTEKHLTFDSEVLRMKMDGHFTFTTLPESIAQTLSAYFPNLFPASKKKQTIQDQLDMYVSLQNCEKLNALLGSSVTLPDSAVISGHYGNQGRYLALQGHIPHLNLGTKPLKDIFLDLKTDTVNTRFTLLAGINQWYKNPTDTTWARLKMENVNQNLTLRLDFRNKTPQLDMTGAVDATIHFTPVEGRSLPDFEVLLNPTSIHVNKEEFQIEPARFTIKDKRYTVENFAISHSSSEYLKLNGAVSSLPEDTLSIDLANLRLQTLTEAFNMDLQLQGEANGKIFINQLLTNPVVLTEGFSIRDIVLQDKKIGTLNLVSEWSAEKRGLSFKAELVNPGMPSSVLTGVVLPQQDSLSLQADIQGIMLDWLEPFTTGTLYGLSGELRAKLQAKGSLKKPEVNGHIFLKDATIGVSMLNTLYSISDSILILPGLIDFRELKIYDENKQTAVIQGSISHQQFTQLNPKLTIELNDFLVINNAAQTDSLFYGNLRLKGRMIASLSGKDILLKANITHSPGSRIMINIPESANEAHQYKNITFINSKGEDLDELARLAVTDTASFSLPIKMDISLAVTPDLQLGAVINPETKDAVQVSGNGLIDFKYDLNTSAMNLMGDYTIKEGKCALSLKNITRKTFTVQEGGKLTFKGDPMATAFNVTAIYSLRADLATLDKSFTEIMSTSTKVPVNCLLTVTGDLNKMVLSYRIVLPGEREEIQRKLDGLLSSDEIRIKEIAYLLAVGSFIPSSDSNDSGPSLWSSLASSSITSQLNNMLSGVLAENWSIGTELHSGEGGFSDMEMDVNISTRLFNDRLTLNSNIGYHNASSGAQNNFTGDFDIQYKLNRSGNVILKVYNVTNNQYFETARTTQGLGVMYKKESRTFKGLFLKIKGLFK